MHAVQGEEEAALAAVEGDDAVAAYNRFVLTSAREAFDELRLAATGDLALLLRLAAFRRGFIAVPPQPRATGHVVVHATLLAGQAFARRAIDEAAPVDELCAAAELVRDASPLLAARYYSDWVALAGDGADAEAQLAALRRARELVRDCALEETKAELAFQYAMLCQASAGERKALLLEAVAAYQESLGVFRREGAFAERYALANMNLAVAYLAMPGEGDAAHLRPAIAIQSLREALKVFTRETNPYWWATATMNLATALQEAPTARPAEHLNEAVALYDDVLDVRRVERDAIAIARTQANAGNALVHLGEFARAIPRLEEAAQLFETEDDAAAAAAVRAVLHEAIVRSHEPKPGDGARIRRARAARGRRARSGPRARRRGGARPRPRAQGCPRCARARRPRFARARDPRGRTGPRTAARGAPAPRRVRLADDARHRPPEHRASRRGCGRNAPPRRQRTRLHVDFVRIDGNVAVVRLRGGVGRGTRRR